MGSLWCEFILEKSPLLPYHYGTDTYPKEVELALQVFPMQMCPTKAIIGPSGSSMLLAGLPKGSPVLCCIAILPLPPGAFMHISLKASGKEYACGEYDKIYSSWDAMVCHYLQDHLWDLSSLSQV